MRILISNSKNSFSDFLIKDLLTSDSLQNSQKIVLLEKAVEMYKQTREVKNNANNLNQIIQGNIEHLGKSLESIAGLLKMSHAINQSLDKFGQMAKDPNLNSEVNKQKNNKIFQIVNLLKSFGSILLMSKKNKGDFEDGKLLRATALVPLIFVIPFFAGVFFVLSNYRIAFLILGIGLTFLNTFLFIILNRSTTKMIYNLNLDYNEKGFSFDEFEKRIKVNNKFFLDAAWVDALRFEARKVNKSIQNTLFGKTQEEAIQDIEKYKKQIEENDTKLNQLLDTAMTSEEYLNIRRELDILNLEKDENDSGSQLMDNTFEIEGLANLEERTKATVMAYLKYSSDLFQIKII